LFTVKQTESSQLWSLFSYVQRRGSATFDSRTEVSYYYLMMNLL